MDLPITIEPMSEEDLEIVAAIELASFSEPWSLESFQRELAYNQHAIYLVARHNGMVIAYIGGWVIFDEAHITTLAVEAAYRRHGIAAKLVQMLIEKCLTRGATCLTLEVRPSNIAARCLYEKLNFAVKGARKRYYLDEDALIMTKENLEFEDEDREEVRKNHAR